MMNWSLDRNEQIVDKDGKMIANPNYKQFAEMPVISTEDYLNAHKWNDWQEQIRFHDGKYSTKAFKMNKQSAKMTLSSCKKMHSRL